MPGIRAITCGAALALGLASLGGAEQAPPAAPASVAAAPLAGADWTAYGAAAGADRFSTAAQITPQNVKDLKVAWTYRIGPASDGSTPNLQMTPLKIGDSVYICSGENVVDALDAETGVRRWRFEPHTNLKRGWVRACRGVAYYKVPNASGPCAERIYTTTLDARLLAIDARTGKACEGFGAGGTVDLSKGMGKIEASYYSLTSPPTVVRGKLVVGGSVNDNQKLGEPAGVVRAYDAVTGAFAWAWDVGRPDTTAEPPEGQSYTRGTPNVWAPASADEALGLVYLPTGNATPDYFGGARRPFDDKYSSSIVAVDVDTGKVRWSFQTTHHDLWDYDVPAQASLVDLPGPSGTVQALVLPTKRGEVFLLDRTNGRPLTEVQERPAPQGAAKGDYTAPTQPFSVGMPGFNRDVLTEKDMWGLTPLDQLWCRIQFRLARYDGPLTPPGLKPTINYPGSQGGTDWGGVAVDPERRILVVNSSRMPNYTRLIPRAEADAMGVKPRGEKGGKPNRGVSAMGRTPYAVSTGPFLSPLNVPCIRPPYGRLSAVDLRTHKLLWSEPLGTAEDSGPWNIASHLPITMGVPNTGGAAVTRSGLIFISATQELALRAVDVRTGKILWKARLPAGGQATPMTYISPASGRQFVVIAAGGHAVMQTRKGDYIIAYALPKPT
jgi:quinoprotein glucose dehydrogenase